MRAFGSLEVMIYEVFHLNKFNDCKEASKISKEEKEDDNEK
jgi:hypothetical protein